MIDKATVAELHRLYERRETMQRAKERATDRNFWLAIVNEKFGGTGWASDVRDALGGPGGMTDHLMHSTVGRIEEAMKGVDHEIETLGGQP